MSISPQRDERMELYEAFKKSLAEGSDDAFFDADDLVVIVDQASDMSDTYVMMEALMRGYRYFADNDELAVRRAALYGLLGMPEGVTNAVAHHSEASSPLWKILEIANSNPDKETLIGLLDNFLQEVKTLDDESAIRLVQTAAGLDAFSWLLKNEVELRRKTEYLPSLLFEIYINAPEGRALPRKKRIAMLEELTEIEPFSLDFWTCLGREHMAAGKFKNALSDADYALAIDSESEHALAIKAGALMEMNRIDEAVALLTPMREAFTEGIIGTLLAQLYVTRGEYDELLELANKHPESREIMDIMLRSDMPDFLKILPLFGHYKATDDHEGWMDWVMEYYSTGQFAVAKDLLSVAGDSIKLTDQQQNLFYSCAYLSGAYELLSLTFEHALSSGGHMTPDLVVAGLLSAMRCETKAKVKSLFSKLKDALPLRMFDTWTLSTTLRAVGFSSFMGMAEHVISLPGKINVDLIDIFEPPTHFPE